MTIYEEICNFLQKEGFVTHNGHFFRKYNLSVSVTSTRMYIYKDVNGKTIMGENFFFNPEKETTQDVIRKYNELIVDFCFDLGTY